ncbi:syndecan isoform X3 [Drosophila erecta]|uniref:syndecan isoform X3 n=1 Tax=Drosophila erecta TaxID=7220 RepID=UPI000F058E7A|nr:syndecan isoform X3 [Drosophila erecta]
MKPKQKISVEPLLLVAILIGVLVAATHAQDQKSVKPSAAAPSAAASRPRDEIYIDDDSIEGSGGRGGIHEDLEKDPDYSGSGFGPDDEDAEPDQHSHSSHNTRISQSSNSGINTAHTPTQTSSTIPTTSSSTPMPPTTPTTITTTPASTPTAAATQPTTFANSSTSTTTTAPTIPAEPQQPQQPLFPPFDKDLDTESSGDGIGADNDDDDEDDGDDGDDKDYDYNKELDKEIDIDGPESGLLTPVVRHDMVESGHHPITDEIDVDGGDEDDRVDSDIDGPVIGGNDGDITERGRGSNVHELDPNTNVNSQPSDTKGIDHRPNGNEVVIMSEDDRTSSFFSQPGILAAVIGGAVVGLLCAILVVMFIVYRMRKKDEGSYALDEPKRSPANNSYAKNANNREFYA